MAKYLRYAGEFLSRAGITWRVEILQEAAQAFATVGDLTFEADRPLTIEWRKRDKEEPICGSVATIRVESPGDRTYEDLYTIEVGKIRMDVYRAGTLFWSGALDPEFYEEPYERAANYPVQLIFSDFGILDRLKYNLADMQTAYGILSDALARSTINYTSVDQSMISTYIGDAKLTLGSLRMRSDNYYDEDGEASSLKEVLEGILQPLGLRMVQRNGRIWVYDLNGLYNLAQQAQIVWNGSRQTMGVDKVANNVKITWNTYAQGGKQGPEDCYTQEVDINRININNTDPATYGNSQYFSFHYSTDLFDWVDATDAGFTLWLSQLGANATLYDNGVRFFKIVEQNDGQESEGVAIFWTAYSGSGNKQHWSETKGLSRSLYGLTGITWAGMGEPNLISLLGGTLASCGAKLFGSSSVWLPPVDNPGNLLLRVTLPMLMDCRFNPFESASNLIDGCNQEKWYKLWEERGNFVYVPVTLKFQPDGSNTVYCWSNRTVVARDHNGNPVKTLEDTYGSWSVYNAANDDAPTNWGYLCYWDKNNDGKVSGVLGWKTNRPGKNTYVGKITTLLKEAKDGQYVPYPTSGRGGRLWLEVRKGGWIIIDDSTNLPSSGSTTNPKDLWYKISQILFKLPQFEIVNRQQFDMEVNTDDVEYQAEINGAAKEAITIDTICGTHKDGVPTARGAYFNNNNGAQLNQFTRAGRTTQAEELLIGTLYSQYAQRRTTLDGEAELPAGGLKVFTEQNQGEKLFLMRGEVMDVITDTSDASLVELRPDEYDKAD